MNAADSTPETAHERGWHDGLRLWLPLCPYPRSQALLRDSWNQGVAEAHRQQMLASDTWPNQRRAHLLAAAQVIS